MATDYNNRVSNPHGRPNNSLMRAISLLLWNFTSQWFLIPQGTGIIAVTLHQLNYQFEGLETISEIVWVYTIVLLSVFVVIYCLRICVYPRHVAHELRYSITETSCLASVGIALTTIMQMICFTLVHQWGHSWSTVAYVLWWIVTVMAVVAIVFIPYIHVAVQPPGVEAMSPAMLIPIIAACTSASAGGILCVYGGISPQLQGAVIVVSYLLVGAALPLAMCMVDIFQSRLVNRSFPSIDHIYKDMLLCGPFGQGSFALLIIGTAIRNAAASTKGEGDLSIYNLGSFMMTAQSASALATASQFAGLLVWAYATFWWLNAVISIVHTIVVEAWHEERRQNLQFSMAAWSLVFPFGVYTNATIELGTLMSSTAFNVWSTILLIILLLVWIVNHVFTIKAIITGDVLGTRAGDPLDGIGSRRKIDERSTEDPEGRLAV